MDTSRSGCSRATRRDDRVCVREVEGTPRGQAIERRCGGDASVAVQRITAERVDRDRQYVLVRDPVERRLAAACDGGRRR
jgi:hypothetical protein